ncbi:MAG: phosphomannomutase/phosphoglucomutase [Actinomycetota bacterium]|jgi:phosphomannomutase|nr:phosphomannomutase/phosphoglucomutase [Actinomycetota bacterium]
MSSPLDAIFKAYDVRGTVPDQLDSRTSRAIGEAFARFAGASRVVVGRDMRRSGEELAGAFAEGVRAAGVDVVDVGLVSTDLLYFASGHLDAPGAMFTASHNPAAYNGIKFCLAGARPVGQETGLADVQAMAAAILAGDVGAPSTGDAGAADQLAGSGPARTERPTGTVSSMDLLDAYAAHVRSFIDVASLRPLRVVADTANGMGGLVVPRVLDGLPVELHMLYPELDGTFPNHPADPIQPENLRDLQAAVVRHRADIGLAFDGDADRVFLVDEHAQPVSGSLTTALVARGMLADHPGATVLYNLICSKVVPETIVEAGGVPVRTRVGHSFIKQTMAETGAVFGGEHSGHYYFRDNYRADSGIIAALMVLQEMSRRHAPLSALLAPLRRYWSSGELNTEVPDPAGTVEALAGHLAAQQVSTDRSDGLTAEYEDWWFNLRPSNTEPLLRLNVEAADAESGEQHVAEVLAMVGQPAKGGARQ